MTTLSKTIAAPTGGWDTESALADMPENNAVILDNFFPETDAVTLRKGNTIHCTGLGSSVETLMQYSGNDGSSEMFGVSDGNLYDVSTSGAVGAPLVSGLSNSRFQYINIGNAGGIFLIAVNGVDTPLLYDGTTWGNTSINVIDQTKIAWCNVHQRRLWVGEKDSLDAYYLPTDSISGDAVLFPLGGIAKLGGYIVAMGTWTRDGGDGTDDVAIFLTSEGEAIIYSGTDPSDVNYWTLTGVFRIGKPIGRRCMIKAGADLVMITQDGFVTALSVLTIDRSQYQKVAISRQINSEVNNAARNQGSLFGWECFLYPQGKQLVFNIPQNSGKYYQYVFNTLTGAPCRFTGINAICFCLMGNNAYWGDAYGNVLKYDDGLTDNGASINGDALQAFNYFGSKGNKKSFKMVNVLLRSNGLPSIATDLNLDFDIRKPTAIPTTLPSNASLWGSALWGKSVWSGTYQIFRGWRGVRGIGRAASLRFRVSTKSFSPSWISTSFNFVLGGQL